MEGKLYGKLVTCQQPKEEKIDRKAKGKNFRMKLGVVK